MSEIDDKTLAVAAKKAVEVGLLPEVGLIDAVGANWRKVKAVAEAVAGEIGDRCEARLERARAAYDALREAIEVEHGARLHAERERDALIEACLDYWKYTVPDDPDPPEPFTLVECWINRLEGDDAGYISREAAVAAVRKAAGLGPGESTEERT